MQILKGLALGLVSFLLFIALPFLILAFTLNTTVLNPQFMVTEIGKLDVPSLAKEIAANQLTSNDRNYLPAINSTIEEVKPWINQQTVYVINGTYDYLLGKTDNFNLTISTGPVKPSLVNNMTQAYMQSPPPEYQQLSAAEQKRYVTELRQEYMDSIPASVEVNQDIIGPDGMKALQQAKEIFGYIRTAYFGLIGFCVFLILLIILILREVKGVTRSIGIVFVIAGVLNLASFFLGNILMPAIPLHDLPNRVQSWLPTVINDIMNPYKIASLVVLIIGIVLLVVSFLVHSRQAAPSGSPTPSSGS